MRIGVVVLAAVLAAHTSVAHTSVAQASAAQAPTIAQRLKPAVVLEGRPDTSFSIVDRLRYHRVPGVSIAVVDNFRIVYAAGFGVTEFGGNRRVDTTTLFLAGSISKPVFATGALRLVEEGRLSLDTDVNGALKSWKLPESRFTATEKVTLRRLLSHTAGLTVWGFPGYRMGTPVPSVQQILDGVSPSNTAAVRNDTTPGARWLYSGGGITIAQLMAADATGEAFPALMRRLVLDPAGMRRSTFENPLPRARDAEAASGHEPMDTPVAGRYHVYPEMAAAGLWTTASDLARWALAVTRAYNGDTQGILTPTMAQQMISRHVRQQPPYGNGFWGLGVGVAGEGDSVQFSHGGRDEGFVANAVMWPKLGKGIFIMTNSVNGALMTEILRGFADLYGFGAPARQRRLVVQMDSAALARIAGTYQLVSPNQRDTLRLIVTATPTLLRMEDPALGRTRYLMPGGNDEFFDYDLGTRFAVEREGGQAGGAIRGIALIQGTGRSVATRISR